jgi:hypothetical protein
MHLQFADRNFKAAAQHWSTSKPIQKVGFECAVRALFYITCAIWFAVVKTHITNNNRKTFVKMILC